MRPRAGQGRRAFTLVELLVVISIIGLLVSLLLPSLKRARDQAKAMTCGSLLHGLGRGLHIYGVENDEWIPGRNTTGLETWIAGTPLSGAAERLGRANLPVQTYDWMTPILRLTSTQSGNRAQRFRKLFSEYGCPSVNFKAILYSGSTPPDNTLFAEDIERFGAFPGVSYLMPVHFQYWGRLDALRTNVGYHPAAPTAIALPVASSPTNWEVKVERYRSRINLVGQPSEKIAVADGTRYLDATNLLDFDHHQHPGLFGAFTSAGAWWQGGVAYGIDPFNESRGKNLPLSYRHSGGIEAQFFDGHVEKLTRKQSRRIDYWYPKGGIVVKDEGIDDYAHNGPGYVIR